ncbi:MAG: sigma-70 family RNA polymerase sigma factor, partial [Candidatus Zixiibacteriota bacterium]
QYTMSQPKRQTKTARSARDHRDERQVRQLVAQFRAGDKQAFARLVQRYRDPVAALAFRMVSDHDEAADIAQDVFVKMSRNIGRYDETRRFSTWLYRVTVNASIDHMRRHNRHRHESLEDFNEMIESAQAGPELSFRRRQLGAYINEAARSLNDKQRSAFVLRDIEGCRIDDVADIMDMPQATVRWYLHRARSKIRKELSRRCPHLLLVLGIR